MLPRCLCNPVNRYLCRNPSQLQRKRRWLAAYSTVTDFARFRGWSTSVPFSTATW